MIWLALAAIAAAFIGGIVLGRKTVVTGAPTDASADAAAVEVLPAADEAALNAEVEARKKADAALHATAEETKASVDKLRALGRKTPVMLALLLAHCAAGPATAPAPASAPAADCLDLDGQRELLAGVEVLFGERSAQLARCQIERGALMRWGQQEASRADNAESRTLWVGVLTSIGGAALAAAITAAIEAAVQARQHPAVMGR